MWVGVVFVFFLRGGGCSRPLYCLFLSCKPPDRACQKSACSAQLAVNPPVIHCATVKFETTGLRVPLR